MDNPVLLANDRTLLNCDRNIDSDLKKLIRPFFVLFAKIYFGFLEVGRGFQCGFPLNIPRNMVRVGRYCYIGKRFSANGPITIGDLCMISTDVAILGDDHLYDVMGTPTRLAFSRSERKKTVFEADCWIGAGAKIKEGVTLGRGCVVGASSFVTKSVPPYAIVAGTPARVIRYRFCGNDVSLHDQAVFDTHEDKL